MPRYFVASVGGAPLAVITQYIEQQRLAELLRREAAHRKTLHGWFANRVLALGRVVKMEKPSYRAFGSTAGL